MDAVDKLAMTRCPRCNYQLHRDHETRCTECGLEWHKDDFNLVAGPQRRAWTIALLIGALFAGQVMGVRVRSAMVWGNTLLILVIGTALLEWWYRGHRFRRPDGPGGIHVSCQHVTVYQSHRPPRKLRLREFGACRWRRLKQDRWALRLVASDWLDPGGPRDPKVLAEIRMKGGEDRLRELERRVTGARAMWTDSATK